MIAGGEVGPETQPQIMLGVALIPGCGDAPDPQE